MESSRLRGSAYLMRWWRAALLLALIISASAAVIFWAMRPSPSRDPVEFLPASTRLAVDCDLRLGSPALRQARRTWGDADLQHLAERAVELAQDVTGWTAFDLDVRRNVLPWFGGELVVAGVTGDRHYDLGPDSLVLILRVKSERRARATLLKAVRPFVRDAYWHPATERHEGDRVTVWFDVGARPQLSYATKDGCLLVGRRPETIFACLQAGRDPAQRLTMTDTFIDSVGDLPSGRVAWGYADVSALAAGARTVLPALRRGWLSALHRYANGGDWDRGRGGPAGAIAFAIAAAPHGLEVRGLYRRPHSAKVAAESNSLARVANFAPKDALLSLAVRRPAELLDLSSPEVQTASPGLLAFAAPLPSDLMISYLGPQGRGRQALALAAPAGEFPLPPRGVWSFLFPFGVSAVKDKVVLLATDQQALKQCLLAAAHPPQMQEAQSHTRLVLTARPARLSAHLAAVQELRLTVRETDRGGEARLTASVPPHELLGEGPITWREEPPRGPRRAPTGRQWRAGRGRGGGRGGWRMH